MDRIIARLAPIIGTAGWAIPRGDAAAFGEGASVLQRYATRFAGVEINSSFHRPHRRGTWERWGESVPPTFRFAVKLPKVLSHERRLVDCGEPLGRFVGEVGGLGDRLAILLLQLPPKLAFDQAAATDFFALVADTTSVGIVCEPRHPSWFSDDADMLLRHCRVARAAADPAVTPAAAVPGGWQGLTYHRLHGSPVVYRSSYADDRLAALAVALRTGSPGGGPAWCMFDNTASGAATSDALRLDAMLAQR